MVLTINRYKLSFNLVAYCEYSGCVFYTITSSVRSTDIAFNTFFEFDYSTTSVNRLNGTSYNLALLSRIASIS